MTTECGAGKEVANGDESAKPEEVAGATEGYAPAAPTRPILLRLPPRTPLLERRRGWMGRAAFEKCG
jgi:hypothetical protein